ncbi:DUF6776 family protein [Marinagarivorans algicola]|uniref:DUF6776 family protein n=1 Tax=Marinagarivorans algicola TaxID=1513270 RepID=UPI0006B5E78F|nr:DUF6776 family protein [Marinagarivorans algicola]
MASVKASKQHRLVVVRHRPALNLLIRFTLFIAITGAGIGGYMVGYYTGGHQQETLEQALAEQQEAAQSLKAELNALTQQLVNTKTGAEVDRGASETIRQELLTLKSTLQKTQEENTFYRNIMNPPKGQKGPAIGQWQVSPNGVTEQYDFKLVVKQLAKHTHWVKGRVELFISGLDAQGQAQALNYQTLAIPQATNDTKDTTAKNDPSVLNVRFRYFQTLTGTFKLPKNFTPQQVTINLMIEGKKTQTITKSYDW